MMHRFDYQSFLSKAVCLQLYLEHIVNLQTDFPFGSPARSYIIGSQ